jgi:hypothetical protein
MDAHHECDTHTESDGDQQSHPHHVCNTDTEYDPYHTDTGADLYRISHSNSKYECHPEPDDTPDLHAITDTYTEYDTHRISNGHNHVDTYQYDDQNRISDPHCEYHAYDNRDIHTSGACADYSADYEYGQGLFA